MNSYLITVLVLVAIPIAAILIPAALTWARDFSALSRRVRRLEEQSKIITFWESWMRLETTVPIGNEHPDFEAEELISTMKKTVRRELADAGRRTLAIYKAYEVSLFHRYPMTFVQFQRYRANLSRFRRAFLFYKAANPKVVLYRAQFYFILAENVVGIGLVILTILGSVLRNAAPFLQRVTELSLLSFRSPEMGRFHKLHPLLALLQVALALGFIVWSTLWLRSKAIKPEKDPSHYVRDQIFARYDPPGIDG